MTPTLLRSMILFTLDYHRLGPVEAVRAARERIQWPDESLQLKDSFGEFQDSAEIVRQSHSPAELR